MATGFTPISSSASMTAICASPRAPPPPSASAKVFILAASSSCPGLTGEAPGLGGEWPDKFGPRRGVGAAGGAIAHAADDALQDRRDAEEIVSGVRRQVGSRIESGALHVSINIRLARGNAERGQIATDERAGAGFRRRHVPLHQVIR